MYVLHCSYYTESSSFALAGPDCINPTVRLPPTVALALETAEGALAEHVAFLPGAAYAVLAAALCKEDGGTLSASRLMIIGQTYYGGCTGTMHAWDATAH